MKTRNRTLGGGRATQKGSDGLASPRGGGAFRASDSMQSQDMQGTSHWQQSQGYLDSSHDSTPGLPSLQPPLLCRVRPTGPDDLPARYSNNQQAPLQALLQAFQTFAESQSPGIAQPSQSRRAAPGRTSPGYGYEFNSPGPGYGFDNSFGGMSSGIPGFDGSNNDLDGFKRAARAPRDNQVFASGPGLGQGLGESMGSTAPSPSDFRLQGRGSDEEFNPARPAPPEEPKAGLSILSDLPDMLKEPPPDQNKSMKKLDRPINAEKMKDAPPVFIQPSWTKKPSTTKVQERALMTGSKKTGSMDDPVINQLQQMETRLTMIAQAVRDAHITDFDSGDLTAAREFGPYMNGLDNRLERKMGSSYGSKGQHSAPGHKKNDGQHGKSNQSKKKSQDTYEVCTECDRKVKSEEGCKDEFPDGDGEWYCFECLKEIRPEIDDAAIKIQTIQRGKIARKKVNRLKKGETPSAKSASNGKEQLCGDCGEMKSEGDFDPDTGEWFCTECWAKLDAPLEEEKPKEKKKKRQRCGDCGKKKEEGRIDEDTGSWFCNECWAALEEDQEEDLDAAEEEATASKPKEKVKGKAKAKDDGEGSQKAKAKAKAKGLSKETRDKGKSALITGLRTGELHKAVDKMEEDMAADEGNKKEEPGTKSKDSGTNSEKAKAKAKDKDGKKKVKCAQCGEKKTDCTEDPADGQFYCPACWEENNEAGDGEEAEEEQAPEGCTFCDGCHEYKKTEDGEQDPESDNWFCNGCWEGAGE